MKGLIVEKEVGYYIVLTSTGEYKKIVGFTKMNIGQEIPIGSSFSRAKVAFIAAALLVLIILAEVILVIPSQTPVYAYVTLDINPSVEFAIDKNSIVLRAFPRNPEAEQILSEIAYSRSPLDVVLADFTKGAIEHQYISKGKENYVVVSFYPINLDESAEGKINEITKKQREVIESSGQEVEMDTIIVDSETREEAKELGISPGKLKDSKNGQSENSNTINKENQKDIKKEKRKDAKKESSNLKNNEKKNKQQKKNQPKDTLQNKKVKVKDKEVKKETSDQRKKNNKVKKETSQKKKKEQDKKAGKENAR